MDSAQAVQRGAEARSAPSKQASLTPDTWVLAGTDKGGIIVWDLATRTLAQIMEGHMASVLALAVHPTGAWVASGSAEPERTIRVWKHVDE
jgi:WD40 repeat protein